MPKAIKVIANKKPGPGRKAYKKKSDFVVSIQYYRKGSDINRLGGMSKVRAFSEAEFDRQLALITK